MADDRRSIGVRVRPNSHDFIRHLRADLATKKYTFYVDVGAKTAQATKDVRAWANGQLQKIHASVPVTANTGKATAQVADWRRRQAGFKTEIPVSANMSEAFREVEVWRKIAGRDLIIDVKANITGRGVDSIRKAVEKDAKIGVRADTSRIKSDIARATQDQPGLFSIEVDAGTKKAKAKVKEFFAEVQGTQLEMDLGIDTAPVVAEVEAVKKKVEKDPIKAQLQLDTTKAKLELLQLRIKEKARKLEIDVDIKRGTSERIFQTIREIEKRVGNISVIRSLDLGPLNLGKPSGLVGTIATLTTLAGLVPAAVTGIGALADALMRLSGAAAIVPGAIGGIVASIATLALGTQGVGDAFGAMFDMWKEGASEQQADAAALVSTHNNYTNAVKDEAKAQEDVGRARRDALGDLRDLNNELRGAVLNEAQAILDVQKARAEYAKGAAKGGLEEQQLRLNVFKAEQGLVDLRERNIELGQKANDAQAKGVEGSDKVQNALDAQTRAAQQTAAAVAALTKAQSGGRTAVAKFNDALGLLSPNAQEFVETFAGMKDEIFGFRNALQDTLFQGAGPAFRDLFDSLMPTIGPGMQSIAEEMNKNLLQVFDTLKSPEGESIIDRILGGTADMQKAIGGLIDPMVLSIGRLTAAGTEHMPQLIQLFTDLFTRFDAFLKRAEETGALDKFMDEGIDALSDLAETGINVIEILHQFSNAFRDSFGEDVLSMIARLTGQFADFLGTEEGQGKLNGYMQEAKDLWAEWKPLLEKLPELFKNISDVAQGFLDVILPGLTTITNFFKEHPALFKAFITAWLGAKVLTGVFSPLYSLFKGIKGFVSVGTTLIGKMATGLVGLPGTISTVIAKLTSMWDSLPTALGGKGKPFGIPGVPGAPAVATGTGLATAGVGAAVVTAFGALLATASTEAKNRAAAEGRTSSMPIGPRGMTVQVAPKLPAGVPEPQTDEARKAVQAGVDAGEAPAKWIAAGFDTLDWQKRYVWVMKNPGAAQKGEFPHLGDYMSGGYTDWAQGAGYPAILHGKEYVQPADTVSHYGVDAMKAVHEKKAAISFQGGGMAPTANPNWGWQPSPWWGQPGNLRVKDPTTGTWLPPPTGSVPGPPPGITSGGGGVSIGGGLGKDNRSPWSPPGGTGKSPFRPLVPRRKKSIHMFQEGGYVDPLTGQWVDPADPRTYTAHGSAQPAPVPTGQGSLAGVFSQGVASGIPAISNALSYGLGIAQSVQGAQGGAPGSVLDIATGAAPGGPAPGPGAPGAPAAPGSGFLQSLLGVGGDTGPGWPGGTAPVGLGGSSGTDPATGLPLPGLDIRNFGIGPGPPGSGPADWAQFAGATLGKFGSGLFTSFATGVLDFFGLAGIMGSPYAGAASGIAGHFVGAPGLSGQGEPASAEAEALLQMYPDMATNPDYPGVPNLPDIIDPATGEVKSGLRGLQTNTARGKEAIQARFPWATNIGGAVPRSGPQWHPRGLALDVMIPGGTTRGGANPKGFADGQQLYEWLKANQKALGIDYMLWQTDEGGDHFTHIHVNFAESGFGPGNAPIAGQLTPVPGAAPYDPSGGQYPYSGGVSPFNKPKQPVGMPPAPQPPMPKPAMLPEWLKELQKGTHDQGGWLMPGVSVVSNMTGKPELVVPGFQGGGYATGALPYKPRPPDIQQKTAPPPPPTPPPTAKPPAAIPPPVVPPAPPPSPPGTPPPPGVTTPSQGPSGGAIGGPSRPPTGVPPSETGMHVHPALQKGIRSGAAALGNAAATAMQIGASILGAAGGGGAAASFGGSLGASAGAAALGGLSSYVAGLFTQGGKIVEDVANVGSSFLVGNITGGTTENPYGVTQRGNVPSGGTRVINASTNHYGDITTNNLDEYMKVVDRREAQKAQSGLGRWGNA